MNKNYYELYINNVFSLAETVVIKSEDTAFSINSVISATYGADFVDPQTPTTWKYYKNICGLYHATDKVMRVTSLDTLQSIDFTSENLTISNTTRQAYQYGSRNYNELVSLYPNQEMLILGILYPAKMDHAVSSKDGTVLAYPSSLVEENEVSLIKGIQLWITKFTIRWHSSQFGVSDDLYATTFLGLIYVNLVPLIINLRLKACKTNEAHSFHVRQYLTSHGMLDVYLEQMSKKQALFFYRNIAYIERNSGKREIFSWLVEHILTERGLPLAEYVIRHDVSSMPGQLYAGINFNKNAINTAGNSTDRVKYNLAELLGRQQDLEVGNKNYIEQNTGSIKVKLQNSLSSVLKTKVLESSLIDYTDATPYTLHETALNLWMYLSSTGKYSIFVSFKNPRTGVTTTIQTKDAFAYFYYVFSKALKSTPVKIPKLFANRVVRVPMPSAEDILSVADKRYVKLEDAKALLSFMPRVDKVFSVEEFLSLSTSVYNASQSQLKYTVTAEHEYRRGLLKNMMARSYCDVACSFAPEAAEYPAWLAQKSLPDTEFTQSEYLNIFVQLFESATGSKFDSTTAIRNLQKAMISLMKQLSSYSVQFISETAGSNFKVLEHSAIRIGDRKSTLKANVKVADLAVDPSNLKTSVSAVDKIDTNSPYITLFNKKPFKSKVSVELTVKPSIDKKSFEQTKHVSIGNLHIHASYANGKQSESRFIGYEVCGLLSNKQKIDLYCECSVDSEEVLKIDLTTLIIDTDITGFIDDSVTKLDIGSFLFVDITTKTLGFTNGAIK